MSKNALPGSSSPSSHSSLPTKQTSDKNDDDNPSTITTTTATLQEIQPKKQETKDDKDAVVPGVALCPNYSNTTTSTIPSMNRNDTRTAANTTGTATTNQRRFRSKAVGFGRNYFHAFGGMEPCQKMIAMFTSSEGCSSSSSSSTTTTTPDGAVAWGCVPLSYYQWDEPPWQEDDVIIGSSDTQRDEIRQVAATAQSTVYLTDKGKVYQTGTLHGRIYSEPEPILIPLPLRCVEISAGRHFCLARMEGGLATVSWGAGHFGQLGVGGNNGANGGGGDGSSSMDGQITFTPQPVIIERLLPHIIGSPIEQISAGDWHALARSKSGRIWAFGSNRSLQCGRKPSIKGAASVSQAPTLTAPLPVPLEGNATYIAAGRSHSLCIVDGQVFAFGGSIHGQCGNPIRRTGTAPPKKVEGLSDLTVIQVAAGGSHSMALTTGGRVFTWGAGCDGELGLGQAVPAQLKPRLLGDLDFVAIEAGQEWKTQQKGPVASVGGTTTTAGSLAPSPLPGLPKITKIFAGPSYCAAISSSGHLYTWGSNDIGQLGIPTPQNIPLKDSYTAIPPRTSTIRDMNVRTFDSSHNVLLPTRVDAVKDLFIRDLACGPNHLCCIGEDRTPEQWKMIIGRTLYEVQEEQRLRKLHRARNALIHKLQADPEDGGVTEGTTTQTDVDESSEGLTMSASPDVISSPYSEGKLSVTKEFSSVRFPIMLPETPSGASLSTATDVATPATMASDDAGARLQTVSTELATSSTLREYSNTITNTDPDAPDVSTSLPGLDSKSPNIAGKRRRFSLPRMLRRLSGRLKDDSATASNNDAATSAGTSQRSFNTFAGRSSGRRRRNKRNSL